MAHWLGGLHCHLTARRKDINPAGVLMFLPWSCGFPPTDSPQTCRSGELETLVCLCVSSAGCELCMHNQMKIYTVKQTEIEGAAANEMDRKEWKGTKKKKKKTN